uniref:Putative ribonuclease H-like domain-containing protein n=1 Tax=Tanacetum cinerariifolium TaxID=118510 RepID=A0A6L2N5V4_TANCI|nr:putative ribonuclease H-like domain-containing protein [Tanacetum cinerariifolium]
MNPEQHQAFPGRSPNEAAMGVVGLELRVCRGVGYGVARKKEKKGVQCVFKNMVHARIETIRLFLAYASCMGFMKYQMNVKSAFLYGRIKEEVYACQPLEFKDPDHPDKVYVDDIIFGSTKNELCVKFERQMKDKFQMSSMGELTFFLGLQVKQKEDGIFISQDKYVAEVKKSSMVGFGEMIQYKLTTGLLLLSNLNNGEQEITATVDAKEFTVTKQYEKRIFGEHTPLFPSMLEIQAEDGEGSGHPSEPQPPPSTAQPTNEELILNVVSSSHQKTQKPRQALNKVTELPQTSEPIPNVADEAVYEEWDDKVERAASTAASLDAEQASGNINRTQSTTMHNVPFSQGIGVGGSPRCQEAIEGSISQTRSEMVPTPFYDSPLLGVHTPGSDEERFEQHELTSNVQQQSNDPPLSRGHLLRSREDNIELIKKLMETYTKLSEQKKKRARTPQPIKMRFFKVRVESSAKENLDEEDPSKQGRSMIEEIDQDAGVTLVQIDVEDQGRFDDETNFDARFYKTYTKRRKAVSIGSDGISTASRLFSITEESVSTDGASMPVRTAGMVQEVIISIPSPVAVKDKGKGKMEESKDQRTKRTKLQQKQDMLGHEVVVRLQEELDEEERQMMARVYEATQSFTEKE